MDYGRIRDVLYDYINYLESLQSDANDGDWLKNDSMLFYEACIEEVETYIERFEEEV